MRTLTFAVNLGGVASAAEVAATARRAEQAGMGAVTVADHLGAAAPFQLLAAAAAVTERVRLRTYVLDAYFWNPALLAREVATLDVLSGGRVELGIGAGHMEHEHDAAGLPFPPIRERWVHVEQVVAEVREQAGAAGRPDPVLDVLVQSVQLGRDPREAATELVAQAAAERADWFDVEEVLATPFFLFAETPADAVDELLQRSERWGVTSWSTHAPSADAMVEVVAAYQERTGDAVG